MRCLRCVACDSPGDNACLNAVLLRGPSDADDYDALVDVQAASRLPSLVCAVMRLEKEMWGVLGRRWSGAEGAAGERGIVPGWHARCCRGGGDESVAA